MICGSVLTARLSLIADCRHGMLLAKSAHEMLVPPVVLAQVMAAQRMLESKYNEAAQGANDWGRRAELAVRSNNDELAREALRRKKAFAVRPISLQHGTARLYMTHA